MVMVLFGGGVELGFAWLVAQAPSGLTRDGRVFGSFRFRPWSPVFLSLFGCKILLYYHTGRESPLECRARK